MVVRSDMREIEDEGTLRDGWEVGKFSPQPHPHPPCR